MSLIEIILNLKRKNACVFLSNSEKFLEEKNLKFSNS